MPPDILAERCCHGRLATCMPCRLSAGLPCHWDGGPTRQRCVGEGWDRCQRTRSLPAQPELPRPIAAGNERNPFGTGGLHVPERPVGRSHGRPPVQGKQIWLPAGQPIAVLAGAHEESWIERAGAARLSRAGPPVDSQDVRFVR